MELFKKIHHVQMHHGALGVFVPIRNIVCTVLHQVRTGTIASLVSM